MRVPSVFKMLNRFQLKLCMISLNRAIGLRGYCWHKSASEKQNFVLLSALIMHLFRKFAWHLFHLSVFIESFFLTLEVSLLVGCRHLLKMEGLPTVCFSPVIQFCCLDSVISLGHHFPLPPLFLSHTSQQLESCLTLKGSQEPYRPLRTYLCFEL